MRALKAMGIRAQSKIHKGEACEPVYKKYDMYGSYNGMFFDITRWRYDAFYPGI